MCPQLRHEIASSKDDFATTGKWEGKGNRVDSGGRAHAKAAIAGIFSPGTRLLEDPIKGIGNQPLQGRVGAQEYTTSTAPLPLALLFHEGDTNLSRSHLLSSPLHMYRLLGGNERYTERQRLFLEGPFPPAIKLVLER